jgi:tetratricopeptide (TPR) repeat protein
MTSSTISRALGGRRVGAALTVAGLLLAAPAARAQSTPSDPVAAQALFKSARELVDAGNYAAACPKFEASLALQASASTMLNIAKCHEHAGRIASAWDDYNRALTLNLETKGADRRKGLEDLAKKGVDALTPRLPKLRIVVSTPANGLKVVRDGKEIPAAALGDALPADPGPHDLQVSAPGYRTETRSVSLEEGKTATAEFSLVADPAAGSSDAASAKKGVPPWAWISGAAGLALAGAAIYFLADDLSAIHALRSPSNCAPLSTGAGYVCNPRYDYAADNARKDRDLPLALGLGGVGVVALGFAVGGIVRGVAVKKQDSAAVVALPWVAPGGAGAALTGRF